MGHARRSAPWLVVVAVVANVACFGQEAARKISKAEAMSAATSKTQPDYPPVARQFRVEGNVELEAVIGETGKVEKVNVVSGNAMLTRAAAEALKGWKFTPFTEDGKPVRALAPISFTFKL